MTQVCLHALISGTASALAARTEVPAHDLVPLGPVAALVTSAAELDDPDGGVEAILAHDALLRAYLAQGPVLPVRFGTCFSSVAMMRARVIETVSDAEAQLAALAGAAEYGLVVETVAPSLPPVDRPAPPSGRDFLRARKADRDAGRAAAEARHVALIRLDTEARRLARAYDPRQAVAPRILSLSLLLDQEAEASLRAILADWARATPSLVARLDGPWPPYSFATAPQDQSEMDHV